MSKNIILGVDVGGTKIRAGLVTPQGSLIKSIQIQTEAKKGKNTVLKNIETCIEQLWNKKVTALGLGIAGLVDTKKGIFIEGPNLPADFSNIKLANLLKKRFNVPVTIDNDVHCFTLAEAKIGAGRKYNNVLGITLGTGIGGGIVIDGKLYRGRNNAAGEIGHTIIDFSSKIHCGCKNMGHFESYASGTAMANLYTSRTTKNVEPIMIEEAAYQGDPDALAVIAFMSQGLAVGLTNLIYTFNPDIIIVGGSLRKVEILWKPIKNLIAQQLIYSTLSTTPIVPSKLGSDANLIGAALLTRE